jgi:phosphopantetheine--protein transferase-like protein
VDVDQVRRAIDRFGEAYLDRIYTDRERATCRGSDGAPTVERLAARFAAKEAAFKVLRPTQGVAWRDIEITIGRDGAPELSLTGTAERCRRAVGLTDCALSLTHDGAYAAAVLVGVADEQPSSLSEPGPMSPETQETTVTERIESIRAVLAEHGRLAIPVSELENDTSLYGAGLTSHATVSVMLALEDEFDIEFPENLLRRSSFESIHSLDVALETVLGPEG